MVNSTNLGLALCLGIFVCYTLAWTSSVVSLRGRRKKFSQKYHCEPFQKKYPHVDPFFGIDLFIRNAAALSQRRFFKTVSSRHDGLGETYQLNLLGTVGVMTQDHENMKAILSTNFKDYSLGDDRKNAFQALLGNGIFSVDGASWAHSRALLRPQFARAQLVDLSLLEKHVGRLIHRVPSGEKFDLQQLLFSFTIDTATEFLFGESTDSLLEKDQNKSALRGFAESLQYSQDRMAMHLALGRLAVLNPDPKFVHHVRIVHRFIDEIIGKALQDQTPKASSQPYIFLQALIEDTKDARQIRDEVLNILVAGRDTTASLISNIFFLLSKRPSMWEKLRNEVLMFDSRPPTLDEIPRCKYIRYTINEALRLHPPVPINSRVANQDTVIPHGGGIDGQSPVFVPRGMPVVYNVYGLHRRRDIYGPDAEEFKPERWESLRVGWEFLPFSGGPRICIGQQFAILEASYVLIRFLQVFKSIEAMDERPWEEKIALTTLLDSIYLALMTEEIS